MSSYLVWFTRAGEYKEEKAVHPAEVTTVDDLLDEYRDRGQSVIEIRYLEPPDQIGQSVWYDPH